MKKLMMVLLLILGVSVIAIGCSDSTEESKNGDIVEVEEKEEVEEAEEEVEEEVEIEVGDTFVVGKFEVKLNSIKQAEDYEGEKVVVADFSWTNNSEETVNWLSEMYVQGFQDGIELETSFISSADEDSDENTFKDIRPGHTLDGIKEVFLVRSENELEIEVMEWLTISEDAVLIIVDFPTE